MAEWATQLRKESTNLNQSFQKALESYLLIFLAEIDAIKACALEVTNKDLIGENLLYIMSDGLAELKVLSAILLV